MASRIALATACVAVLLGLLIVLTDSRQRQAGSNYVPEAAESQKLRGDAEYCQPDQTIPKDAAGVRLLVGTYGRPTPAIAADVKRDGRQVTSGRLPAGSEQGHVVVPLRRVERTVAGATVCLQLTGEGRTVLYGRDGLVRFEWQRPGDESWLALASTVAHRFALGKANPFGSLLLPLAILLLLAAWLMAGRLLLREVAR